MNCTKNVIKTLVRIVKFLTFLWRRRANSTSVGQATLVLNPSYYCVKFITVNCTNRSGQWEGFTHQSEHNSIEQVSDKLLHSPLYACILLAEIYTYFSGANCNKSLNGTSIAEIWAKIDFNMSIYKHATHAQIYIYIYKTKNTATIILLHYRLSC